MTTVTFYRDEEDNIFGFEASGHADFAKPGKDIVCASISILTVNFVNSVEKLTDSSVDVISDNSTGYMKVTVKDYLNKDIKLLFESLRLGLNGIQENYSKNLKLTNRRCKP